MLRIEKMAVNGDIDCSHGFYIYSMAFCIYFLAMVWISSDGENLVAHCLVLVPQRLMMMLSYWVAAECVVVLVV